MLENNWRCKSLQHLEKNAWGNIPGDATPLITRCYALRKIPLNEFSIEDIRLMIGQGTGLTYLVILAIEILQEDLFAEGDMYLGDLLQNVLNIPADFWNVNKLLYIQIKDLIADRYNTLEQENISLALF